MADRNEILALLARLTAANPTFRVPTPTAELWCQKLAPFHPADVAKSVESFIERGGRVPSVGDVYSKAKELQHDRVQRETSHFSIAGTFEPISSTLGKDERKSLYDHHFEIGRRRQQDRFEEADAAHQEWLAGGGVK